MVHSPGTQDGKFGIQAGSGASSGGDSDTPAPDSRRNTACDTYGAKRLNRACAGALAFGDARYKAVKGILSCGLDEEPTPEQTSRGPRLSCVESTLLPLIAM